MNKQIKVTVYKDGIDEETFVENENGEIIGFYGYKFDDGGIEDDASDVIIGFLKFLGFDVFEIHKTGSAPMSLYDKKKNYEDYA